MAYDRYDPEQRWREGRRDHNEERGQRASWGRDRDFERGRSDYDRDRDNEGGGRGFFERMGEEVRSWFGDEDDHRGGDYGRHREDDWRSREHRERSHREDHARPQRWSSSESDYNRDYGREMDRGYRPMAGDYARSGGDDWQRRDRDRSGDQFERDPYRRTSFAGSRERSNHDDLHYSEWRRRQMEDLDREYHDYRRERQSRFEDDFGGWRERRQSKRQLLSGIREHMEVVGRDEKHVGTVDRVAGDRIILTKSDPEAGGVHHSLSCTDVDRVEGNRVILDCDADKARERWRDESRSRALFEREDQGDAGPHILDRSFSGTYR
jgi:hypothetical protein